MAHRQAQSRQNLGDFLPGKGSLPQKRLPQLCQQSPVGALLQQNTLRPVDHHCSQGKHRLCLFCGLDRQLFCPACSPPAAEYRHRTAVTLRRAVGQADQRPKLHQSLVEVSRPVGGLLLHHPGGEQASGLRPGHIGIIIVQPGKYPQHIAVHRRSRQPEADAGNRACGVIPDARQRTQGIQTGRQLPAVLFAQHNGSLLQVGSTAVIPQPLPQLAQPVRVAGGQGGRVRQLGDEPLIVGDSGCHPCLLQHDLADPDMIRRRVLPKRQDPTILFKPWQQFFRDAQHQKPPQVRGKGSTSRMLAMPVTYMIRRSKPRP